MTFSRFDLAGSLRKVALPQAPPSLHLDVFPVCSAGLLGMPWHATALQVVELRFCVAGALG
ncbi:MAG: hypothetical protein ACI31F_03890 [Muribaculaceae bacterium]